MLLDTEVTITFSQLFWHVFKTNLFYFSSSVLRMWCFSFSFCAFYFMSQLFLWFWRCTYSSVFVRMESVWIQCDGCGISIQQYCLQTCDGSPGSPCSDTQWPLVHSAAAEICFCPLRLQQHSIPFFFRKHFCIILQKISIPSMCVHAGSYQRWSGSCERGRYIWQHLLFMHEPVCSVWWICLHDRRLFNLELTAEAIRRWLMHPVWQTGPKPCRSVSATDPEKDGDISRGLSVSELTVI